MEGIVRGDICLVSFTDAGDNVQRGCRPAVVIGNDIGNKYSPILLVTPITSKINKTKMPTHVMIPEGEAGLSRNSLVLAEQIHTVNKSQVQRKIGSLSRSYQNIIDRAVKIALAL